MAQAPQQAKQSDVVVLEDPGAAAPSGPCCATCAHFAASTADRRAIERVGGIIRGECHLAPEIVRKEPRSVCASHPELLARQQQAVFEPLARLIANALRDGGRK